MKFAAFNLGDTFQTEKVLVTKEDILRFATEYDPQYFHVDEEEAKESPYGSLIASGFHTLALVWAEWIKMDVLGRECLGGIGAEIKWTAPVRANDQLTGVITVIDKKEVSTGDRGLLTIEIIITNQQEEKVLVGKSKVFVKT